MAACYSVSQNTQLLTPTQDSILEQQKSLYFCAQAISCIQQSNSKLNSLDDSVKVFEDLNTIVAGAIRIGTKTKEILNTQKTIKKEIEKHETFDAYLNAHNSENKNELKETATTWKSLRK